MKTQLTYLVAGVLCIKTYANQLFTKEDCIEPGTVEWPDDQFFNSEEYQKFDASTKLDHLWDMVNQVKKPQCQQFGGVCGHFEQAPNQSLKKFGDEMPLSACKQKRREKLMHAQGVVGKGIFESYTDNHSYTGIFQGAKNVLIRFSESDIFHDELSTAFNPSVALKFLRDKVHSANQFGMVSFEGTSSWDFFENDLNSILPVHKGKCGPKTIAKFNAQSTPFLYETGSYDMARYKEDGTEVEQPNYPYMLRFKPNREELPVTKKGYFYEKLRGKNGIPKNTVLFEVYAVEKPTDWSVPGDDQGELIGVIKTTDEEYTTSLWGDEILFFQHGDFQADIDHKWASIGENIEGIPEFDFDEFNHWPPSLEVPDLEDGAMIDRWEETGCPFQWVIDAFDGFKKPKRKDRKNFAQVSVELC